MNANGAIRQFQQCFEFVSHRVPPPMGHCRKRQWLYHADSKPVGRKKFLGRYYDQEAEALRVFNQERRKMAEADP